MGKTISRIILTLAAALVLTASLRSLLNSTFFPIHDFTHVARLVEMDTALKDGHFPPRWSKNLGYGYGMPLFTFYGPLPFFVAEVFYKTGFSALASVKMILITAGILGWLGTYFLTKRWFGRIAGVVAATAFVFTPYRALDIFVRGAFNEVFAISLVPWILLGIEHLREEKSWKPGFIMTALSLFGLFTSHNLMTLMFVPMIGVYALVRLAGAKNKKHLIFGGLFAGLLAFGLAAFYLLPSFLEKDYTQVDKLISGYGMYNYHFLYLRQIFIGTWAYGGSVLGIEDDMAFFLGWTHTVLAAVGGLIWFWKAKGIKKLLPVGLGVITLFALFMTSFKSSIIWDKIPLIAYIQFPWRFLSVSAVTVPLFAGASMLVIHKKNWRFLTGTLACILLIILNIPYHQPRELLDKPEGVYYTDPARISKDMSGILPDYIPKTVKTLPTPLLPRVALDTTDQPGKFEVVVDRTQEILVSTQSQKDLPILFRVFSFPGWKAYVDSQELPISVDNQYGWMRVTVPKGEHSVSLIFEDTLIRTYANIISVVSLLILGGLIFYDRRV